MRLELKRENRDQVSLTGTFFVDGMRECLTLERVTVAIPAGLYSVELSFSHHLQRVAPLIDNVPGRTGIRIHSGNKPEDSEGCLLVGVTRSSDGVCLEAPAHPAEVVLTSKILSAIKAGERVTLAVLDIAHT